MRKFTLFSACFFVFAFAKGQSFQHENYHEQSPALPEEWTEIIQKLSPTYNDSILSPAKDELYRKGYQIASKKVLEALDKVELISCSLSSLASTEVHRNDYEILRELRHQVWVSLLSYSPEFATTIVYVDYMPESWCSKAPVAFLLNTKGNVVLSVARVAAIERFHYEHTKFISGNQFKFRSNYAASTCVFSSDEEIKRKRAAGMFGYPELHIVWFQVNSQGQIVIIRSEEV